MQWIESNLFCQTKLVESYSQLHAENVTDPGGETIKPVSGVFTVESTFVRKLSLVSVVVSFTKLDDSSMNLKISMHVLIREHSRETLWDSVT